MRIEEIQNILHQADHEEEMTNDSKTKAMKDKNDNDQKEKQGTEQRRGWGIAALEKSADFTRRDVPSACLGCSS